MELSTAELRNPNGQRSMRKALRQHMSHTRRRAGASLQGCRYRREPRGRPLQPVCILKFVLLKLACIINQHAFPPLYYVHVVPLHSMPLR